MFLMLFNSMWQAVGEAWDSGEMDPSFNPNSVCSLKLWMNLELQKCSTSFKTKGSESCTYSTWYMNPVVQSVTSQGHSSAGV